MWRLARRRPAAGERAAEPFRPRPDGAGLPAGGRRHRHHAAGLHGAAAGGAGASAAASPLRMLYGRATKQRTGLPAGSCRKRWASRTDAACRPTGGRAHRLRRGDRSALPAGGQLYTCGPVPMLEAVKRAWAAAGAAAGRPALRDLRQQRPAADAGLRGARFRAMASTSPCRPTAPCSKRSKAPACRPCWDCRRGECGLCAMDVLAVDGEIDHRDVFLSEHEKAVRPANLRLRIARGRHDHHRFGLAARQSMSLRKLCAMIAQPFADRAEHPLRGSMR